MKVLVTPTEIQLQATDTTEKDRVRAVPGARWNSTIKAWTFPATPYAAGQLTERFQGAEKRWRKIRSPHLVMPLLEETKLLDGKPVENDSQEGRKSAA